MNFTALQPDGRIQAILAIEEGRIDALEQVSGALEKTLSN